MLNDTELDKRAEEIRDTGYTVLEGAIPESLRQGLIEALDRIRAEHDLGPAQTRFEGLNTVRINNLLTYDDIFWEVPLHADALGIAERLLDPELLLTSFCSLIVGPGQEAQPMHEDTQLIPLPRPHLPITINAIWALSPFTAENGATRFVPGSHRHPEAPAYGRDYPSEVASMPAGSIMLFDSALWHGAGANNSALERYAFSCAYCCGWMRQQENLQLGIPRETAQRFPRRLQELCGYGIYRGQFGHIDNRDPIELLGRSRGSRTVWEASDIAEARRQESSSEDRAR